jgi:hypothetical protein
MQDLTDIQKILEAPNKYEISEILKSNPNLSKYSFFNPYLNRSRSGSSNSMTP